MNDNNQEIHHQWSQRSDLDNWAHNQQWLSQFSTPLEKTNQDSQIVFSHIPKNAGTTLEYILAKNFKMSETLHINAPDLNKNPNQLTVKKNPPQLICGHHPIHGLLYQLLPDKPITHITMLRNPVDRVISYFNYLKTNKKHTYHNQVINQDFDTFLQNVNLPEITNGQCKRLSGNLHSQTAIKDDILYQTAKTILKNCFSIVLITEKFDLSILLLQKILNLSDVYYFRKNQSDKQLTKQQLSKQQVDRILQLNMADHRLYKTFASQFSKIHQQFCNSDSLQSYQNAQVKWRSLFNLGSQG